ncbi:hypothetical protein RB213_003732 [Colletotrichum asianum]
MCCTRFCCTCPRPPATTPPTPYPCHAERIRSTYCREMLRVICVWSPLFLRLAELYGSIGPTAGGTDARTRGTEWNRGLSLVDGPGSCSAQGRKARRGIRRPSVRTLKVNIKSK